LTTLLILTKIQHVSEPSPYQPPASPEGYDFEQEQLIRDCEIILGSGKGHTAVIQHLRKNGRSYDEAKKLSYFYFDAAKKRLMRSQLVTRLLAHAFIIAGIALPAAQFLWSDRVYIFSAFFLIPGVFLKTKIVNPARLPET
jgi:hypothetical protein